MGGPVQRFGRNPIGRSCQKLCVRELSEKGWVERNPDGTCRTSSKKELSLHVQIANSNTVTTRNDREAIIASVKRESVKKAISIRSRIGSYVVVWKETGLDARAVQGSDRTKGLDLEIECHDGVWKTALVVGPELVRRSRRAEELDPQIESCVDVSELAGMRRPPLVQE